MTYDASRNNRKSYHKIYLLCLRVTFMLLGATSDDKFSVCLAKCCHRVYLYMGQTIDDRLDLNAVIALCRISGIQIMFILDAMESYTEAKLRNNQLT